MGNVFDTVRAAVGGCEGVAVELARVVIHQKGDQQFIHLRERHGPRGFPIVIAPPWWEGDLSCIWIPAHSPAS